MIARRRGMTLVEVMVVIALIAVVLGIAVPGISAILDLERRDSARTLAQTYTWLLEEAALRNVSFRVAYNLDEHSWRVEVGDPRTLVFDNPEARRAFEQEIKDQMTRFTRREIEEGAAEEVLDRAGRFEGLNDAFFTTDQALPAGSIFASIYTPQYAPDGARPPETPPGEDEGPTMAYTYVFPDGSAEHTVVRIVDRDDETEGWTIEVEPISGVVRLSDEVIDPTGTLAWLPDRGPEIR